MPKRVFTVAQKDDGVFGVCYMTPCRGKWKWGRTDLGELEEGDIILFLVDT